MSEDNFNYETPFVFQENQVIIDNTSHTATSNTEEINNKSHNMAINFDQSVAVTNDSLQPTVDFVEPHQENLQQFEEIEYYPCEDAAYEWWAEEEMSKMMAEIDNVSYITRFENNQTVQGTRADYTTFLSDANNPTIAQICQQIKALDRNSKDYKAHKRVLKDQLPLYTFCGYNTENNRKEGLEMTSNGNVIIDIDGVENEEILEEIRCKIMQWNIATNGEKLLLLHRSPSYYGYRVIYRGNPSMTMVENQIDFFNQTNIPINYRDKSAHEIKRLRYMVCSDYIIYINEDKLFSGKGEALKIFKSTSISTNQNTQFTEFITIPSEIEWNQNTEVNQKLINNYFKKYGFKRYDSQRHNHDRNFGQSLKYFNIPENEILSYYNAYIAKFKNEGYYFADDPSETSEGIKAVIWGYYHPNEQTELDAEEKSETNDSNSGDETIKVPFYDCNFDTMINNFRDIIFQLNELDKITLPKEIKETLSPIMNDNAMRHLTIANLYNILTNASTYLHQIDYAPNSDCYGEKISLMTLVSAETSEGKSLLKKVYQIWAAALVEEEEECFENFKQWKKDVKKAKKDNPDFDEDDYPEPPLPILSVKNLDSTNKGLFDVCQINNGRRFSVFCEEISTLSDSCENKNFGIKTSTICNIYDTAELTEFRSAARARELGLPSGQQKAIGALNIISTGVPISLDEFFKNDDVANGKASRFHIIEVDKVYDKPFNENGYPDKKINEKDIVKPLCRILSKNSGTFINKQLNKAKKEWYEAWLNYDIQKGKYHKAIDTMKNRAMDMGYRFALTLYFIEAASAGKYMTPDGWYNIKGKKLNSAHKVSDNVLNLFQFTANFILATQVRKFAHKLRKNNTKSTTMAEITERYEAKTNFDKLEDIFTREDFYSLYSTENSAKSNLSKLKKAGRIIQISKNLYRKTNS